MQNFYNQKNYTTLCSAKVSEFLSCTSVLTSKFPDFVLLYCDIYFGNCIPFWSYYTMYCRIRIKNPSYCSIILIICSESQIPITVHFFYKFKAETCISMRFKWDLFTIYSKMHVLWKQHKFFHLRLSENSI